MGEAGCACPKKAIGAAALSIGSSVAAGAAPPASSATTVPGGLLGPAGGSLCCGGLATSRLGRKNQIVAPEIRKNVWLCVRLGGGAQ